MRTAVWLQAAKRRKKCEIPGFFQRFPYFWRKSVLAVPICLMTVFPGGFPVALDLGLRQGTDHLGGAAQDHGPGGSVHFAGDQCPGTYNAVIADLCAVENGGAHADEHVVAHGAAVDNGPVADGAAGTDRGLLVQHRAVLNVGVVAHFDGTVISAEDGIVPHVDILSQGHVSHDGGTGTDKNGFVKFRFCDHKILSFLLGLHQMAKFPLIKTGISRPSWVVPTMERSAVPTMKSTWVSE